MSASDFLQGRVSDLIDHATYWGMMGRDKLHLRYGLVNAEVILYLAFALSEQLYWNE